MNGPQHCPKCGAELPDDAPAGLCPRCLVAAGFESEVGNLANQPKSDPDAPTIDSPSPGRRFLPPLPTQLADKFPQLEILELLGHGGMGAVYKARQTNLDRIVALKIIRPEATHDPTFAERFNREAKTLARLSHQHIVAVHDFGEIEYSEAEDAPARLLYYFLMEYVDGQSATIDASCGTDSRAGPGYRPANLRRTAIRPRRGRRASRHQAGEHSVG